MAKLMSATKMAKEMAPEFMFEGELQAVGAAANVQVGYPVHALGAEDSNESLFPWDHGAVVDAGDVRQRAAADDRVFAVSPEQVGVALGAVLPGDVGEGSGVDL